MNTSLVQQQPVMPGNPNFTTVGRGFHPKQVEDYLRDVFAYVGHLEGLLARDGAHAAEDALHAAESPRGQREIVDLMRFAVEEIEGQRAAAAQEVAQMIADARANAQQIRSEASQEAASMSAGARQQADTVLSSARAEAKRMTDKAAAESAAVSEGAGRRMDGLRGLHEDTLRRMTEIRDVMQRTLDAEAERGTLDEEMDRALDAATGPAQITAPQR